MTAHPSSVAVLGPGLMGGSLLMALRRRMPGTKLAAWARRDDALKELKDRGLADVVSIDPAKVVESSEIVVFCVPVENMTSLAESVAGVVGPATLVTDVGSVKGQVVRELEEVFAVHRNFVGSHPMCGSEEAGLAAAREDLYEGAVCAVTPSEKSRPDRVAAASDFWSALGARVITLSPEQHDRAAAMVSHVPHVAASALVETVFASEPVCRTMCAGGFRDTTRVASGAPDLWTGILSSNRAEVARGIGCLIDSLQSIRIALENNDTTRVSDFLRSAAEHRAQIVGQRAT